MKTIFSKKHLLLFGLLVMVALIPPQVREIWAQAGGGAAAWSIETVRSPWTIPASSPGSPASNPLALTLLSSGGSNIPAFAYSDGGVMRFSLRSGSGASLWALEDPLAGTTYALLKDISLVTDGTGIAHLSYYADANVSTTPLPGLIYTTRSAAGTWATKLVLVDGGLSTVNAGEFASLLLDLTRGGAGSPCLSYRKNSSSNTLHRKCRTSTGWPSSSTALTTDAIFSYTGSAISGSTSHYTFTTADRGGANRLLNHLRRVSTTSTIATWNHMPAPADPATDDLHFKEIAVDSGGQSHIVMYSSFSGDVFYLIRPTDAATDLSTLQIDGGGAAGPDVGRHISLAICPSASPISDSLHVAYYDQTNQALKYARCLRSCGTESSWATSFVDPATPASPATLNRGEFTQIACDSSGIIHIGYYDRSAASLKYANNANQCGNALVEAGEVCDDGNQNNCDGCRADCGARETGCGDSFVCGAEQCDTGASRSPTLADACRMDCTSARCGDGVIDTGETCDDANTAASDGCSATCQTEAGGGGAICGNGTIETGEACDDGNTDNCSGACNADCTASVTITGCGDGILCSPEECDDRNGTAGDGCSATCRNEPRAGACGDNTLDTGEVCDDGNQMDCDGCRGDCLGSETGCGDRFVCGAEACDDGNMASGDGCSDACQNEVDPRCGDNIPQTGEECDDGNTATGDGCNANCVRELLARCGDSTCNGDETCTTCAGDCGACAVTTVCGNSVKEGEEECDDGNMNSGDSCSPSCRNEATTPEVRPISPTIGTTGAQPADGTTGVEPNPPGARGARGGGLSCTLIPETTD